ncbi:TetR/AcrR family transcriptional regulator [Galactobacter valiniphilus]|uniref:TetR/AcrR family transcriptional regulator n=1 Tax=Galactobacter valiniphilus TaxID=2676122 RepID=UPI003735C954
MVRPSVADERRTQILEATLKTIAEHGLAKSSLDRIADTAGMSRGHIRHFVGNRDDLLVDTARYLYLDGGDELSVMPRDASTLDDAMEYLFGGPFTKTTDEDVVILGLVELSRTNERIASVLAESYENTRQSLIRFLADRYPNASQERYDGAASSILTAAMGNVFMNDFDRNTQRSAQVRHGIELMLATLE